jgi:hypothetical protein
MKIVVVAVIVLLLLGMALSARIVRRNEVHTELAARARRAADLLPGREQQGRRRP